MKFRIKKEEFEKLTENLQGEYAEKDGVYTLKLEGHEEEFVPKFKKDEADRHRKDAENKTREVEKREANLLKELEAHKGDKTKTQELIDNHQKEVEQINKNWEEKIAAERSKANDSFKEAKAMEFANEKFKTPSLIKGPLMERMTVEDIDGKQVIRVLETDGTASSKSFSDLQKEFLENSEYKSIIKAKSGKGGGAHDSDGTGGGASGETMARSEFEGMTPQAQGKFMSDGGSLTDG